MAQRIKGFTKMNRPKLAYMFVPVDMVVIDIIDSVNKLT